MCHMQENRFNYTAIPRPRRRINFHHSLTQPAIDSSIDPRNQLDSLRQTFYLEALLVSAIFIAFHLWMFLLLYLLYL